MIWILIIVAIAAICAGVASSKGRSPAIWFGLGLLFSLIALVVLLILDDAQAGSAAGGGPSGKWGPPAGRLPGDRPADHRGSGGRPAGDW